MSVHDHEVPDLVRDCVASDAVAPDLIRDLQQEARP